MDILIKPSSVLASCSLDPCHSRWVPRFHIKEREPSRESCPFPLNRLGSRHNSARIKSSSIGDLQRCKSNLETLFCYDKSIPEEIIEKPIGLSLNKKEIGDKPLCIDCQAKGAVLCATCSGSGLYVDSILESQGIIVKVRCLGCGGTGNIMCAECGGRGHI